MSRADIDRMEEEHPCQQLHDVLTSQSHLIEWKDREIRRKKPDLLVVIPQLVADSVQYQRKLMAIYEKIKNRRKQNDLRPLKR